MSNNENMATAPLPERVWQTEPLLDPFTAKLRKVEQDATLSLGGKQYAAVMLNTEVMIALYLLIMEETFPRHEAPMHTVPDPSKDGVQDFINKEIQTREAFLRGEVAKLTHPDSEKYPSDPKGPEPTPPPKITPQPKK